MKKTTIQRQISINVILPVAAALSLIAILNYLNTNRLLTNASENKSQLISEEIKNILEFQDFTTILIENNLNQQIEEVSYQLVKETLPNHPNLLKVSLDSVREVLKLDPDLWDIYLIDKEGIVVNTTFEPDFGLDYKKFGPDFVKFLKGRFDEKDLYIDRLTFQKNSNRKRKFSYMTTLDGQYILELGVYSNDASALLESFKKQLKSIAKEQTSINSVDLFIQRNDPKCYTCDEKIPEDQISRYQEAIDSKSKTKILTHDEKISYEFIYLGRENTDLFKDAVIRIISDRTEQIAVLRKELLILLLIFGVTMAVLLSLIFQRSRKITDPIKKLASNVNRITAGNLNERAEEIGNNEITTLSQKFNEMLESLEESYNNLERKVIERTKEISQQKEEIEAQRDTLADNNTQLEKAYHEIEEQKKRITDSIIYAQRIQRVILPPEEQVKKILPEAFIIYRPKDIVSGDFYWVSENEESINFAAVDCTGHGVPGAFMSLVGNNNLNSAVRNSSKIIPSQILDSLNKGVVNVLRQKDADSEIRDGMDIALCSIARDRRTLQFSGAYRPLFFVRDGEIQEIKGDKNAIGGSVFRRQKTYTNHVLELKPNDCIYIFSDGFTDQFGGPDGRKFMPKRLKSLLVDIHKLNKLEQEKALLDAFMDWKGELEQLDDVLLIGLKIQ